MLDETGGPKGITIVVRVTTPPVEGTFYHLAAKFGAEPDEAAALLKEAHSRGCAGRALLPCRLAVPGARRLYRWR